MRHRNDPSSRAIPIAIVIAVCSAGAAAHAEGSPDDDSFDQRADRPGDRDTVVRITGEQLAARGATDLASALALLPEVTVRDMGRGGLEVEIRGARTGAVSVLIDGVRVLDPWHGTFDVATIPITDIVQIRIATTPQSPIDGPGGAGGVIEVVTRDAIGAQLVIARVLGDSLPSFGVTATARAALARHLALRMSASGQVGARDLELPDDATIGESRRASTGAARLEYRQGDRRWVLDGFLDDRHYIAPPSAAYRRTILLIDRETSARVGARADEKLGTLQLQGQYWVHYLRRRSRAFADPGLERELQAEDLQAIRSGGMLLATRPFERDFRWTGSVGISHDKALVFDVDSNWVRGDTTLINLALGAGYARERVRVDVVGGLARPFGVGANLWPEGKLVGSYRLRSHLEITATTGYKGRVPTLRERFDRETGNQALGPEKALHAEVRIVEQRAGLRLEAAPFVRRTHGMIRASPIAIDMGRLINLGELDLYGVDVQGRGRVHPMVEVGGAYNFLEASGDQDPEPIARLPRHRVDAWTSLSPSSAYAAIVRASYVGASSEGARTYERYVLLEATLSARISTGYLAVVRLENLLDVASEPGLERGGVGRRLSVVVQGAWR